MSMLHYFSLPVNVYFQTAYDKFRAAGTPVGSTIAAVDLGVFALFAVLGALTGRTA